MMVVPRPIDDGQYASALTKFTSSVTSASCSGSVVVQSYKFSLIFTTVCDFLNKIDDMESTMKNKAKVKIGFVN
jgi:hypothetical protein